MFHILKPKLDEPRWQAIRQSVDSMKDEENSSDGGSNDGLMGVSRPPTSRWSLKNHRTTIVYVLLAMNMMWTVANLATFWSQHPFKLNYKFRQISTPSPIFNGVDLGPVPKRAMGSLHDNGNIFRRPPSKEVDTAWQIAALQGYEVINATKADIIAAGEDPDYVARWSPDEEVYAVEVEFSHKIHCLNMLRKAIWGDHYHGNSSIQADDRALAAGEYKDDEEDLYDENHNATVKGNRRARRFHTMHCLHMLLQDIQCNADVGIIPIVWAKGTGHHSELIHVDQFSTLKQCRNIDALSDWVRKNAVRGANEGYGTLTYIPGTKIYQTEDRYAP